MRVIQTEGTPTTTAAPASSPSTRRRVIFMARLAPKGRASARGWPTGRLHENAILPQLFLTFMACGGLTAPILEKTFFSTRRPVPEAGGQRPTARCALGRKSVWNIVLPRGGANDEPSLPATGAALSADPVAGD